MTNCFVLIVETIKPVLREWIVKMERVISQIYQYFDRCSSRRQSLKDWQNFLDMPQLMFERIDDSRWSSIKDCIHPIFINIQPGEEK